MERLDVTGYDREIYGRVKAGWDSVAKPLDSLGKFEELHARIGAIQGNALPKLEKSLLIVSCADNGIVEEGVSQSGQEVTAICAENIGRGRSCVGIMARQAGVDVLAVDVGICLDAQIPGVRNCKIRKGTRNFLREPAMTAEETEQAIRTGMELVRESKERGYDILGIGEMGIGNTTTSSAVTAALLGLDPEEVTGRGAGLSDEKLLRKRAVIREALGKYGYLKEKAAMADALDVLSKVGGFDIACMTGICLGGAKYHVPIVLDGFISLVAALVAGRMEPVTLEYLIPSHSSREPAVQRLERELGFRPVIHGDMALGEGTGAVLALQLLHTICAVYNESCSFEGAGIDPYQRWEKT